MQREVASDLFPIGSKLPNFSLKNIDNQWVNNTYLHDAKAGLVIFSCNHCPYVKGSDQAVIDLYNKYSRSGLKVLAVNSNDPIKYPEDSFEMMIEKSQSMNLPFPYLFDETQEVAKLFDAACTPECFLFNKEGFLVYHGTVNDSPRDPSKVTKYFLEEAVISVLAGQKPDLAFVHPIGCSIKWK